MAFLAHNSRSLLIKMPSALLVQGWCLSHGRFISHFQRDKWGSKGPPCACFSSSTSNSKLAIGQHSIFSSGLFCSPSHVFIILPFLVHFWIFKIFVFIFLTFNLWFPEPCSCYSSDLSASACNVPSPAPAGHALWSDCPPLAIPLTSASSGAVPHLPQLDAAVVLLSFISIKVPTTIHSNLNPASGLKFLSGGVLFSCS